MDYYSIRVGKYYQVRYNCDDEEIGYFVLPPDHDEYFYCATSKEDAINTAKQYRKDMGVGTWVTKITEEDINIPETED